ncbi:carboxylesterase family protein [Vibrio sp. AK197]
MSSIAFSSGATPSPITETESGQVQGITQEGINIYRGIPFAEPPIGSLRWHAPQPKMPWPGIYQATEFSHDCMQKPFPSDAAPLGTEPDEDCLGLNVWAPKSSTEKPLPVMVWIYGGGFVNGGSSTPIYDGQAFAQNDIIVVSFNYRVGRFGFFAHPALSAEPHGDEPLGNYGFMDQIAALKWVKNNIHQFGGDANNITLVGESAGGFSIHTLLTSPLSQGLFQRAIIQSGGGRIGMNQRLIDKMNDQGVPSAEQIGENFAKRFNIQGQDALDALRQLSAEQVTSGLNMNSMGDPTYSGPMLDGKLVVKQPQDYYVKGERLSVPLMMGTTDFEIGFSGPVDSMSDALEPFAELEVDQEKIAKAYAENGVTKPQDVAQRIASDALMVEPTRYALRVADEHNQTVYGYRFAYVTESEKDAWPGAFHATDIPYAFNTVATRYGEKLSSEDQAMADLVHQYWVNFIKYGNPNGDDLPTWQPYDHQQDNLMWFSNQGAKESGMRTDPWNERLDYIKLLQPKPQP